MKIATWNVNSVRARLDRLLAWLQKDQPDIVCLQELKSREDPFPHTAIRQAGYHAAVYGQPTFNGVGILSRIEPQNVRRGMDDGVEDPQARFLAAQIGEIQVLSAYVPNGQMVGSQPYAYKMDWLRRLRAFLEKHFTPEMPIVLCGDFNVARDEKDVASPAAWEETVLFHPTRRAALEELLGWCVARHVALGPPSCCPSPVAVSVRTVGELHRHERYRTRYAGWTFVTSVSSSGPLLDFQFTGANEPCTTSRTENLCPLGRDLTSPLGTLWRWGSPRPYGQPISLGRGGVLAGG